MNRLEITENEPYDIQDHIEKKEVLQPWISTHKSERQVLMQYIEAANRWSISWKKWNL
jgi:hypothetical protein